MTLALVREKKEALLVFVVALVARVLLSAWQAQFGYSGVPSLFSPNAWADFYGVYVPWLHLVSLGWLPYRDFTSYTYTPLFLYVLYPFYLLAGSHGASIPIILSDSATAAVISLIARKLAGGRLALAAGLMYAVCPFALFYEGYLWLSSQPMTFLMLLSVYLLRSDRPVYSAVTMALAIMVKQEALFLLPVYLSWLATRFRGAAARGVFVLSLTLIFVSLPFLILYPVGYLQSLDYLNPATPAANACVNQIVNATTVAVCGGATTSLSGLTFAPPAGGVALVQASGFPLEFVIDKIAALMSPLLFVLALPAMFASRRSQNALELFSVYSLAGFLVVFSLVTHISLSYHYVPLYALLFAATSTRRSLAVATIAPAVALFLLPEGPAGLLVPIVALLAVTALNRETTSWPAT
jgi:hypothetical protein